VMLLSQKLANFTKGEADSLRKAMGKKIIAMMEELKVKFIAGAEKNGHKKETLEKIWKDWEAFAQYAFNKSHSTCYAYVSYQTAYLKAHYPAEFMAAVLSRNLSDIKKITLFMDECRQMGMEVLSPDVNESYARFTVNKKGALRFGMAAIKGVGENAVAHIITERKANGPYTDIFNFVERVDLSTVSKKTLEGLAYAGALDSFVPQRHRLFLPTANSSSFLEEIIKYGNRLKSEKGTSQQSIFGSATGPGFEVQKPILPDGPEWSVTEKLNKEKDLIGIYLSAHPLDTFKFEIQNYTNMDLATLSKDITVLKDKEIKIGGMITGVEHRVTKTGNPFGAFTLEDYTGSYRFALFSQDYINFKAYLTDGYNVFIKSKVQPRFKSATELELKITSIEMLADMREKQTSCLTMKIEIDKLTAGVMAEIQQITDEYKGTKQLKFLFYDAQTKVWVEMHARKHKVKISNELIDRLSNIPEIEFKIF